MSPEPRNRQPFKNVLVRVSMPNVGLRTIGVNGFPIFDENSKFQGFRGASVDMTRQLSIEERLRQSQKMEAVGLLTGGIAHEFNNLLMVVVGNIEMMLRRLPKEDLLKRYAELALEGAMCGADLTQILLSFSRKQTLEITSVECNGLVLGMHDMLQSVLGKSISWEEDLSANLPVVMADAGQIGSALLNLVLNARDAMPDGGKIIVRTVSRTINMDVAASVEAKPGNYISIDVIDTGHGMTAEVIDQAFEPFFTTKNVGEGTGLGLSMVYGFAKQSDGFVEIDSEVGRGTTIRLCLPCVLEEESFQETNAVTKHLRAVILVVEDDPDVRQIVVGILSGFGCVVIEAENGEAALARIAEHLEIDLVFTDVMLPGALNGPAIIVQARKMIPDLKVILTSGYPDQEVNNLVPENEMDWFIRKPYRRAELLELLDSVLQS